MVEIKKALKSHIPCLKKIWSICFGDSMEYIDFFFDKRFTSCECVIAANQDDIPVAAMYLLPVTAYEYGKKKNGFYVYAIGVLPEYRGTGVYKKMHSMLYDYLIKNNMFCILCPANSKLCEYYKSIGFMENAYISEMCISKSEIKAKKYTAKPLSAGEYFELRNSYFANPIFWDKDALEYVLMENEFVGGANLLITDADNNRYFALVRQNEVTESNIPPEKAEEITSYLCSMLNTEYLNWITEANDKSRKILRGLSCNLKKDDYYLNLILN